MAIPGLNERDDGLAPLTLVNAAEAIRLGSLFATLSYGDWDLNDSTKSVASPGSFANSIDEGFNDNYKAFVAQDPQFTATNGAWTLLDKTALGNHWTTAYANAQAGRPASDNSEFAFTSGGLYHGFIDAPGSLQDQKTGGFGNSNALLLKQGSTLVIAFRGTDADDNSIAAGQAFTGDGAWYHYEAFRPLIEAALAYAADTGNGIDNIIVAGHSLGGLMADIFTAVDAKRFADLPNITGNLKIVSIASPGIIADAFTDSAQGFFNNQDSSVAQVSGGQLTLVNPDPYYIAIQHNKDRVADSINAQYDSALEALLHDLNPVDQLQDNVHFTNGLKIFMPNLSNLDVDYHYNNLPDRGFGTHHNEGIYLHNHDAITNSSLLPHFLNQKIIVGVGDYGHMKDNWLNEPIDDNGVRTLQGSTQAEFLLGLEGNDRILGGGGSDLIDGGTGNDDLVGGAGADRMDGGAGADRANYSGSTVGVRVNLLTNVNTGGEAQGDLLYSIEQVSGSNTRADFLVGNTFANRLFGNGGNDALQGDAGNDRLLGGIGNDTLNGGTGNDVLSGDAGNDRLVGGLGDDSFLFDARGTGFGDDTITDFKAGALSGDTISLTQSGLASFAAVLAAMTDLGSSMLLTTTGGSITFNNIADVSAFAASDFVLT